MAVVHIHIEPSWERLEAPLLPESKGGNFQPDTYPEPGRLTRIHKGGEQTRMET